MKKILDYLLSCVYLLFFGLTLCVFHVLQVVAFHGFGKPAHKKVVDWMNAFISYGWYLTGSSIRFEQPQNLPTDRPIIFVANHQSMFDISPIIWFLRRYTPIFVSKIELARGIPGVSYNLRKSGAALIDRKDPKQAIVEIARLGKHIQQTKHSAVIFPEGTRSSSGQMRPFVAGGLAMLLKRAPSALVVPIAVRGTGHFNPKGIFPLTSFSKMSWYVLPGIEPAGLTPDDIVRQAQEAIAQELGVAGGVVSE
ncbi:MULTISPECIES: lysophospholipid acyltransferase family protein [Spirosoma]|uniref:1-acyl-sn-glycerol-3-phosphate acyltransferase n=1 Tax=Spirosoma liriopis TaxID=2937440 RepID=A0ABT0HM96_9BACT|nr:MULTISPECIES: lysophospholipid acyltransferase family protein [Spirosoma]MCK8492680.1 1-acyl-sn-glycerol-3-phosphate acyltransferase [Spirosoma liriopis]UHG92145.1 1-acyl-sn-glycerol-3-phosphate acyltransferase [Spirosoma oryzicola]